MTVSAMPHAVRQRGVMRAGLVGAFLCIAPVASAQRLPQTTTQTAAGSRFVHEVWGVEDGLPVNAVTHLLQTRDGYLWVGTFDGLLRFDGVRFTVYNAANSALPSDRILEVIEGRGNELWIVTEQRHIVRMRDGVFTTVSTPERTSLTLTPLLVERDGTAWVATNTGLARVDADTLRPVLPQQMRDTVRSMYRRRSGALVIGTATRGVLQLAPDPERSATVQRLLPPTGIGAGDLLTLTENADGVLFVGGLGRFWRGRDQLTAVALPTALATEPIQSFSVMPDGRGLAFRAAFGLYAVTDTGVRVIDSLGGLFQHARAWTEDTALWYPAASQLKRDGEVMYTLGTREAAPSPRRRWPHDITSVLRDREGSIWIGTYAAGLHRLKPAIIRSYSTPERLPMRNLYGTTVDRFGAVWMGSMQEGFARLDPGTGAIDYVPANATFSGVARTLLEDRCGVLWVGSNGEPSGLHRCETLGRVRCRPEPVDEPVPEVLALFEDPRGVLWIGTRRGLLRRANERVSRDPAVERIASPVRAFAATPDGAVWMGTDGSGVLRRDEDGLTQLTVGDGLPTDRIRSLHVASDGWLWIGTEGRGLVRLDPRAWGADSTTRSRRMTTISVRDGLFDQVIHQILEDDEARLWMNSNRGVFWISREEANAVADGRAPRLHATGYTERDGMRNREGNGGTQPAGARAPDGRMWFPTQDGVVMVDPSAVRPDTSAPPLRIEQVIAGDRMLLPRDGRITLQPDQRDVRIEYTALALLDPQKVRFRYRLEGYDDDWVDAAEQRRAFYTKLPARQFRFRVQTRSLSGDWFEPGVAVEIDVIPRWYERRAFRLLLTALVLLAGVAYLRQRSRAPIRRAHDLELLVSQRTATLQQREHELAEQNTQLAEQARQLQQLDEARTRFFANVSHELRTPLTLTIGPLESVRDRVGSDPQLGQWLEIATRNARRLLELVNQLLDVAKLEAGATRLSPAPLELTDMLRAIAESFHPAIDRKRLGLHIEMPERCRVELDHDATEKIVTNLLSNAVKFTPPGGHVHLTLSVPPGLVVFTVRNTGKVIPPEQLALLFERFHQVDESITAEQPGTGIGLSLVQELVELQAGVVRVTSDLTGTVFTVTLPVARLEADEDAVLEAAVEDASGLTDPSTAPASTKLPDTPTMLVVDDSEDLRRFVGAHFADRFRVLEAENGEDGLRMAREHLPDVCICDVMMPRLNGHQMVQALRASPETDFFAVIMLTALAERAQKIQGLELGADDYLGKPFEMRELDVRVRNIIDARRRLRDRFASAPSVGPHALRAEAAGAEAGALSLAHGGRSAEDEAYLARVHAAVRAGLHDAGFGVAELADAVFQDRSHLFRRIRDLTGASPSELLRRVRLEEAAHLLRQPSGTVADVAYAVGFRSVSHFCRCFQEQYAVTLSTYRQSGA